MKKSLLFILILALSQVSHSQNCKPYKVLKDKFAGVKIPVYGGKVAKSKSYLFGVTQYSKMYVYTQDGINKFTLNYQLIVPPSDQHNQEKRFQKGETILLRTSAGVKNLVIDELEVQSLNAGSKISISYSLTHHLDREMIEYLTQNTVKAYKLTTSEGGVVQEVLKDDKGSMLNAQIKCFSETVSGSKPKTDTGSNYKEAPNESSQDYGWNNDSSDKAIILELNIGLAPSYASRYSDNTFLYSASVEFPVSPKLSAEPFIGAGKSQDSYSFFYTDYNHLVYGGRLNYYFLEKNSIELFASGGLAFHRTKESDSYKTTETLLHLKGNLRYTFSDDFSSFINLGLGSSVMSIGINYSLS